MEENGQESVNQNKQLVGVSQSKKSTGYKPVNQTNTKPDLTNQDSMQTLSNQIREQFLVSQSVQGKARTQPIREKYQIGHSHSEQSTG